MCPIKPWISPTLCARIARKNYLLEQARKHPSNTRLVAYSKSLSKEIREAVAQAKDSYFSERLSRAGGDYGRCWRIMNEITCRESRKSEIKCISSTQGATLTDPADICNEVNLFFTSVVNDLISNLPAGVDLPPRGRTSQRSFFMPPVSSREVLAVIFGSRNGCAPGLDGISNSVLKKVAFNIVDVLTHMVNLSLEAGTFPSILKTVVVVPVFKKGDRRTLNNYRPITLVSSISKIMEKVVSGRMTHFLSSSDFFSPAQFGFRSGLGCEDAMERLIGDLNESLNRSSQSKASALFIDLTKAFDAVHHDILLTKLECAGFRGVTLSWLRSYLVGREQRVRVCGSTSGPLPCRYGVPQGSILGPLMFLIYINDLLQTEFRGSMTAYADDMALLYAGVSREELRGEMRLDLRKMRSWLDMHGMIMSAKTVLMEFGRAVEEPAHIVCHSSECVGGVGACQSGCVVVRAVPQFRYLGLVIDSSLSWSAHADAVKVGVRQVTRQLFALRSCCSASLLRAFYFALIESRLRYGIAFWGNACASHLKPLKTAQKSAVRAMSFARRREHSLPLFQLWKILPLQHLYVYRVTEIFFKRSGQRGVFTRACSSRGASGHLVTPRPLSERFRRSFNCSAPHIVNGVHRRIYPLSLRRLREWLYSADCDQIDCLLRSMYL